jgi:hypothetical protein
MKLNSSLVSIIMLSPETAANRISVDLWRMNLIIYKYVSVLSSKDSQAPFRLIQSSNLLHNSALFSEFQTPGRCPVPAASTQIFHWARDAVPFILMGYANVIIIAFVAVGRFRKTVG